jgi:hypothetical protein
MFKIIQITFAFGFFSLNTNAQSLETELTKGEWCFCVLDSIVQPLKCPDSLYSYKFLASGKYVKLNSNGKKVKKSSGVWELNKKNLELDPDDLENVKFYPRTIHIDFYNVDAFYSAQEDYETVYWLFVRKK